MPRRKISDQQFQILYELSIPRLYRAALVMMGDQTAAQQAAADAFLQTIVDPVFAADSRAFDDQALRTLCRFCRWETTPYYPAGIEEAGLPKQWADLLSRSTPNERILLALSAVLSMGAGQIAAITGWPRWLIGCRLRYLSRGMQAEQRFYQEEEENMVAPRLVHPF